MLDAANLVALGVRGQRVGQAVAAGAAGAADAVHVVLGLHRQVEVHGVADALHVDATGGHVGGHQDAQLAALQLRQGAGALALVHVAVQGGGGKALVGQAVGQIVGAALGRREDDGLIQRGVAQHVVQQLHLVAGVVRVQQALRDVGVLSLAPAISMRCGSRIMRAASLATVPSSVAENSSVWRLSGRRPMMVSMSSMKPMSSMRSASSSTSVCTVFSLTRPAFR